MVGLSDAVIHAIKYTVEAICIIFGFFLILLGAVVIFGAELRLIDRLIGLSLLFIGFFIIFLVLILEGWIKT